jgi:hypothetical protein
MIEDAIDEKVTANEKQGGIDIEDIIKNLSEDVLRTFIITQAKYIPELSNTILLEFIPKNKKQNKATYAEIIRRGLADVEFDDDYYYSHCIPQIDILDMWIEKAQDLLEQEQFDDATLIAKACIEEFAAWLYENDEYKYYLQDTKYHSNPFRILADAVQEGGEQALFDYCRSEMNKEKYSITSFDNYFQNLFTDLSARLDPDGFIALQDSLLAEISDKRSYEAKRILQRNINLFQNISQYDKAWNFIEDNIQFESFRKQVVEKRIDEGKLQDAKKLIDDFLATEQDEDYGTKNWYDLLLTIAVKENDKEVIKKYAYKFIENRFANDYYEIYKSAFTREEWIVERERLFQHYAKGQYFNYSAAELLRTENDSEALLTYLEKHPSINEITKYYTSFSVDYPEKTIELFQKSLNHYAEHNTGRSYYETILSALRNMETINGGKKAAADLAEAFKVRYKNRKAMIEVLNQL